MDLSELWRLSGCGLIVIGLGFTGVAALGVLRLPDMLCRAHAVSKALTLGMALLLTGSMLMLDAADDPRFLLAILFQFLTIPVAGHLVSLVAYRKKLPRWRNPAQPKKG